jgi:cobalt-zinc-cadmium efflux system outer membrane protein
MQRSKRFSILLLLLPLAACATIPRDAGWNEVGRTVSDRGGLAVEWFPDPMEGPDEQTMQLLQGDLTVDEAVAIAARNNPRLQVALAELGIARADLIEASTITNPVFEFELRFPGDPYRPYELRLAQSLIELIQLPRRRAFGRAAFEAAKLEVSSEVLRFAGDVRAAYWDLVAAGQLVTLNHTAAEASRTAADIAVRQHNAQNITDLDLENEQALYEQAKLDLARSEQQYVLARELMTRALGLRETTIDWKTVPKFPSLPERELEQRDLERLAAQQRLDLSLARSQLEMTRQRVPLSRLEVLEETVLDVHYEREPDGARTIGPGIEFPIPIFNTGRAARTRAEAEFLRARHMLAAVTAESASQIRAARSNLAAARARVEYYRDVVVPRRERIVQLTKLEHNAMLIGVFQLLMAKQNELRARRDFIEAQRGYWTARNDLDRALQGVPSDTSFTPATDQGAGRGANITRGGH